MTLHPTDYNRYFALRQKATLINMSEERDREYFEALSGYVVGRNLDTIELHVPCYPVDYEKNDALIAMASYKLTSESLGNGIQVMTDLVGIVAGNIFQLKLRGNLELFQRRSAQRVNASIKFFNFSRDLSLILMRKEWKRIVDYLQLRGLPPAVELQESTVNLSAGGICISIEAKKTPSPLSIFIIDISDDLAPVCALAETAWKKHENEELRCGHRFIQILKSDQERIGRLVQHVQKKSGITAPASKTNWELVDRMSIDHQVFKK